MINVDMSNIWGEVALPDLLAIESEVAAAHEALLGETEHANRSWLNLVSREPNPELFRILLAAERIRSDSDACVVIGVGGSCLGSRAAVELLQGPNRNLGKGRGNPRMFYAGNNFSTRHWNELMGLLKDQDFSVIMVAGSEIPTESAIAFRSRRWMLERKYGTDAAGRRIYAVTDPEEGALGQMAREAGWETFSMPSGISDEHAVLTAGGLLPMAVAGMDIQEVLSGAADAREEYAMGSFENPVWQYAAVRNLLHRGGRDIEILAFLEPGFRQFGRWWQQLFSASEGKDGKGIFPAPAELTEDLYSLGQLIQEGKRNLLETVVRFDPPKTGLTIGSDWKNLDGLNYLEERSLDFVEEQAYQAAVAAHVDAGVPVLTMDCGELTDRKVGELFCFLALCCGISASLLGVDSLLKTGVESYQRNLYQLLGKPEGER